MDAVRIFDAGALAYSWITHQPTWRAHCREVASHLGRGGHEPKRLLDLGIGPGVSAFAVHDLWPTCHCVGIDVSPKMLAHARKLAAREPGSLELVLTDAAAMPFDSESFDSVLAHSFLYLVPDPVAVMRETARVLAPGARVAMLEPRDGGRVRDIVRAHPREPRFVGSMVGWRVASRNFGRWTEPRLRHVLYETGFSEVTLRPTLSGLGWLVTATR
ncbi:MAG: class I SAM-dependent methyltransferase [Deltaproteobacteria bacterium]|nr:MAG: class I SAM-dependent methyltransferase [Deltaproteobacteria bacterium]